MSLQLLKFFSKSICCIIFTLNFWASPASAQYDDFQAIPSVENLAEMDLEELLGVVVIASGEEESLYQAPAAVTVLDEEEIRGRAGRTVPELLRTVPGVQVIRIASGNFVISLRGTGGLEGNNIIVMIDGVPINSPTDGKIDWSTLPVDVDDIFRIEIVRGPISPIYGANAYTGIISIETRGPHEEKKGISGELTLGGSTDLRASPSTSFQGMLHGRHKGVSWTFRGSGLYDAVFSSSSYGDNPPLIRGVGGGGLNVPFGRHGKLSFLLGGAYSSANGMDRFVLEQHAHRSHLVYGRIAFSLEKVSDFLPSLELWATGNYYGRNSETSIFDAFSYHDMSSRDFRTGFDINFHLVENFTVGLGSEIGLINVNAPYIHPDEVGQYRLSYGIRINSRAVIKDRFILALAGRLDNNAFIETPQLSIRGSIIYYIQKFSARFTLGSAFRNPTFLELGSRFKDRETGLILLEGQSGLNVPRLEAAELGFIIGMVGRVVLRPTLYLARTANLIAGDFDPLVRKTFRNVEENASILGGELELSWDITAQLQWRSSFSLLYFLEENGSPSAIIGTASQNSLVTAWTGLQAALFDEQFILGGGIYYNTPREYNVSAGIPPKLLEPMTTGHYARFYIFTEWKIRQQLPLYLRFNAMTHAPQDVVESPLPGTAELGTSFFLALTYRNR